MAATRNALKDWEDLLRSTDELPSPLEGSPLEPQDASKLEEEEEDAPAVPDDVPELVPMAARTPPAVTRPARFAPLRRGGPRDDLVDAQAADKDAQRKADFERGLDMVAFRKPFAAQQVGTPNADAVMKRMGLERQGRQDELAEKYTDARIANLGRAKTPGGAQDELMRERALGLKAKREGAAADEGEQSAALEQYRAIIEKKLGIDTSKMSEKQLLSLLSDDAKAKVLEDRRAGRSAKAAKDAAKAEAKKGADQTKVAGSSVGYRGGEFYVPDGGGALDSSSRNEFVKKAAASQTVQKELEKILVDLDTLAKNPSGKLASEARSRIESKQSLIAPTINVALGQGAMADAEFDRVRKSIGDIGSRDFWVDALSQAFSSSDGAGAGLLASRLRAAQDFFDQSVQSHAETLRLQYRKGGGGAPGRVSVPPNLDLDAPTNEVEMIGPKGEHMFVKASKVAAAERKKWRKVNPK